MLSHWRHSFSCTSLSLKWFPHKWVLLPRASHSHHVGKGFQPKNHPPSHTQHKEPLWISLWPPPHQVSGFAQHWGVPCIVKVSARLLLLQARSFPARMQSNFLSAALIHWDMEPEIQPSCVLWPEILQPTEGVPKSPCSVGVLECIFWN